MNRACSKDCNRLQLKLSVSKLNVYALEVMPEFRDLPSYDSWHRSQTGPVTVIRTHFFDASLEDSMVLWHEILA